MGDFTDIYHQLTKMKRSVDLEKYQNLVNAHYLLISKKTTFYN